MFIDFKGNKPDGSTQQKKSLYWLIHIMIKLETMDNNYKLTPQYNNQMKLIGNTTI